MVTITDLFCGAGGSSSGAEAVPGVRVRMASNHWKLAIDTHNQNMPHVDHDVADVARVDPRRYPPTDLLWASPSCQFWSAARGEKQDFTTTATEPTLFDLAETSDVDDEPVPDEAKERSRALMHDVPRFAEYHRYKAVLVENTLPLLGWWYFPKWIARMRNLGYDHQVLTLNSAFAHQLGGPAPQLRDRVYVAFWQQRYPRPDFDRWTRPRAWCPSCEQVVTALRAAKNPAKPHGAYAQQYVFRCPKASCRHRAAHPYTLPAAAAIDWTVPGQRIGDRQKPLAPKTLARIEAGLRRYGPGTLEATGHTTDHHPEPRSWPVDQPRRTLHTSPPRAAAPPFLTLLRSGRARTVQLDGPLATIVTSGSNHALVVPVEGRAGKQPQPANRPLRAQTARNETGLLIPLRNNNQPKPTSAPLNTFAAAGQHHGLAMLVRNNGTRDGGRDGQMCSPAGQPMRTLTSGGHQSLVTAGQPPTEWHPDLLYAYDSGALRSTQAPMATQTTVDGDALLQATLSVEDCLFRMLMPSEIKLGMAFDQQFTLLGTKREQVRMCGNAVTPPVARDLIGCVVEAITGDEVGS